MRRMLAGTLTALGLFGAMSPKLAEVDRAKGDKKVAVMAEVVRELVAQRREMHEQIAKGTEAPGVCRCAAMQGAGHGDHQMRGYGHRRLALDRPGGRGARQCHRLPSCGTVSARWAAPR